MKCEEARARVETYLDDGLSTESVREVEAHVHECRDCAGVLLENLQWKRQLRAAGKRHSPSVAFRERIHAQVQGKRSKSWGWNWALVSAALAAMVLGAFLFGIHRQNRLTAKQTFGEVADLHVATLASQSPVDVVSTDRHTVKPWFEGKIPFTFNLPELNGSGFSLVGGRVAYLRQSPGAELIFQLRQHRISVFIFQEKDIADGLPTATGDLHELTFHVETWAQDGLRYFVVGDAGSDDIKALGQLLKRAAHS
jgi:anti-sigma factor RsiW